MCGIGGIVGEGANERTVRQMMDAQRHRGPDGEGFWSAAGVSLGHRRLRIIDLSEAGRQPMQTPDGRYTMIFNGEVFNYIELRAELPNVAWRSSSDSEVILHAYARWGVDALKKFIGMYALAIWDHERKELFCARDRLGIKPFYYATVGDSFAFASELRGLFAAGVERQLNPPVLYDFLARDFYEHTEETFFSGIHKLPPAGYLIVREGRIAREGLYWDFPAEVAAQEELTRRQRREEREEHLLSLCRDAVDLHLRSDVPVGITLSGGLDSATLLTLLDQVHPDPTKVEGFSFTFDNPTYSERPFVEIMAAQTGRRAHFAEVTPTAFTESIERFTASQEEPFAGAPISAYALCFELAQAHDFIVMMDGSGLDECLAGYGRFRPARWADLFTAGDYIGLERELSAAGVNTNTSAGRALALAQMGAAASPTADVGRGQDLTSSVRPECLSPDFVASARREIPHFDRPFPDALRNLMYRELRYTKLSRALRFRDRLSMAVGTELRPPFLDHRLLAYAFALPPEDHIEGGVSKAILRRAAGRLLPDVVRLASKRSVQTPQREWFRGVLKSWVRQHIDTPSFWARGWVDPVKGRAAMEGFFNGKGDNSFFLWQWINIEVWESQSIDTVMV